MAEWILGLELSHDSSGVLLRDGSPFSGVQLERITRIKHDGRKDQIYRVVEYLLDAAGIGVSDLDLVGVSDPYMELPQHLRSGAIDLSAENVLHVGHHLAHAYSAFGPSGNRDATVLVVDGHGDYYYENKEDRFAWGPEVAKEVLDSYRTPVDTSIAPSYETESVYSFDRYNPPVLLSRGYMRFGRRRGYTRLHWDPLAIGQNYRQVAEWLFGTGKAAGKVMGLASYATDARSFSPCFIDTDGGKVLVDDWKAEIRHAMSEEPDLPADHEWAADLAGHVQAATEELMLDLVRSALETGSSRALCMAGGVALNATTNGRIEREVGAASFFVQPASSDCGLALGAAGAVRHVTSGRVPDGQPPEDSWGRKYSRAEVLAAIDSFGSEGWRVSNPPLGYVADRLSTGAVAGWFDGGSELGPRALGHRSILADPRPADMRDRLNLQIKNREWFRPFAPAVLEEHVPDWFDPGGTSLYMLSTTTIRQDRRAAVPAVTHVDGTARAQVLPPSSGAFRSVVEHFLAVTGVPIVLNTSFNLAGEPIVETPHDALDAFRRMPLDLLYIDGMVVER